MKHIISSIRLLVCLFVGFSFGTTVKIVYESNNFKPYSWGNPPIIANCFGKGLSKTKVERAIKYWDTIGEKSLFYIHNPPDSLCKNDFMEGFIIIKKKKLSRPTLASTKRKTSFGTVVAALIYYSPGVQHMGLIHEHELGHAFGYGHADIQGHIMNPIYDNMGKNFWVP